MRSELIQEALDENPKAMINPYDEEWDLEDTNERLVLPRFKRATIYEPPRKGKDKRPSSPVKAKRGLSGSGRKLAPSKGTDDGEGSDSTETSEGNQSVEIIDAIPAAVSELYLFRV
jgi:hypothetical protein